MTQNNNNKTNLSPPQCSLSRDKIATLYWSANMLDAKQQ